jgi:hypothetical protein
MAENQTDTVLKDLVTIQERFIREPGRFYKSAMLDKFVKDEGLSEEARNLAADAVERIYQDVVWEDDVRGYELVSALDIAMIRYRNSNV